ncbi:hypothetical protein AB0O08_15460 [Streptomyces anulatus]|uniref:hypothetical protein n=1 Tax=Streptomyces anulatus TaxID=1892 RepID=UPI003438F27F
MADELTELPELIRRIAAAADLVEQQRPTVSHRVEFGYDGISLATFESTGSIHIPSQGCVVEVHGVEVSVVEVSLNYDIYEGVPWVIATVDVAPVEGS